MELSKPLETPTDSQSLLSKLNNDLKLLMAHSKEEINQFQNGATMKSEEQIVMQKRNVIGQLQKTTVSLSTQSNEDMKHYTETRKIEETQQMTADTEEILNRILDEN